MPIGFWGYPNGNIPTSVMAPIEGGNWLRPDAAYWWTQMVAAFDRDNPGYHLGVSEGYRDLATQQYYWNLYQSGQGYPAARPGNSNHGWAMAVDITGYGSTSTPRHQWLRTHAPSFGWTWTTGQASGEAWHWEFTNTPTRPAYETTTPIVEQILEEDDMTVYIAESDSDDKIITKGWSYKQSGDGPFVPRSNLESYLAGDVGAKKINGNDLRLLSHVYGVAEAEKMPPATWHHPKGDKAYLGPGRLTGRRFYSGTVAQ